MPEDSLLSDEFLRQLINVGEVDILVGIATHNHAKTIGQTVRSIQIDLLNCFPRERAVIINADGGSQDISWTGLIDRRLLHCIGRCCPPENGGVLACRHTKAAGTAAVDRR